MTRMRTAILIVFACASIAVGLSLVHVLPSTNMIPHVLVAATMILALLTIIDESDQTP